MTILLTDAGPVPGDAPVTRIGGVPLAPRGTRWPHCGTCGGPMQFLAQILLGPEGTGGAGSGAGAEGSATGVVALFACQNNPGGCRDWEAFSGANLVLVLPADGLLPVARPALAEDADEHVLVRATVHAAARQTERAADYTAARSAWAERTGVPPKHVLGQYGGEPDWLQYDQTPSCPSCATGMPLVAQLQEGPDAIGAMNFGFGGRGYAFACVPCGHGAFLWQR